MADIARLANVSISTVSHVINRTRAVAPETERAVLAAIAETGYVPDNVVRSQRTVGTRVIGLAMSAISNPYFSAVAHGIERAATQHGYSLLLADTHDDVVTELRTVSDLLTRRVEAVILAPSPDPSRAIGHAAQAGVPVTVIDRFVDDDLDQVGTENRRATASLVSHLIDHGHERIAMISGRSGLSTTVERVSGYHDALQGRGLPQRREYLVHGDEHENAAGEALTDLLALPQPPTAVVVGNNQMTISVMRAARRTGIRVPDDLALVSFDDFEWADLFHPRLTVIAQPTRAIGEMGLELTLARLTSPDAPRRRIVLQPTFVRRDSCGCDTSPVG